MICCVHLIALACNSLRRPEGLAGLSHHSHRQASLRRQSHQRNDGSLLRGHQPAISTRRCREPAEMQSRSLGNRKPIALGTRCGVRRGRQSGTMRPHSRKHRDAKKRCHLGGMTRSENWQRNHRQPKTFLTESTSYHQIDT